jgi:polyisoprenoid-binding protein YceI
MKHIVSTSLALLTISSSLTHAQISARSFSAMRHLAVRGDSRLWIEGSSNLRDWSCEATALDAAIDVDSRASFENGVAELRRVQVRVPVSALKCGRDQMDRIMYKALRADDAPECRHIVGSFDVVTTDGDGEFALKTLGRLRVAGHEKAVRLDVDVEQLPDGTLRAQGALPILMTDYGITPPTALFGVIRTDNRIVVKFDLLVDRQAMVATTTGGW